MQPKTNRKKPDRIILFEIGIILALLFVNFILNLTYKQVDIVIGDPHDPFLDSAYTYVEPPAPPIVEPEVEPEKIIEEALIFDPTAFIKQVEKLFETKETVIAQPKAPLPSNIKPIVVSSIPDSSIIIVDFAEVMPEFPGGEKAMRKFIAEKFYVPEVLYNITDKVEIVAEFVIDKKGNVTDIKILKCSMPGYGTEGESIKVISKMPKWNPGNMNGRPVKVRYKLPIVIQTY